MIPTPTNKDMVKKAIKAIESSRQKLKLDQVPDKLLNHQREEFPVISMGLSHRGRQKVYCLNAQLLLLRLMIYYRSLEH